VGPGGGRLAGERAADSDAAWPGPLLNDAAREWGGARHREALEQCCRQLPVDLVHMHSLDFWRYLPSAPVPVVATLHLPPEWYPREIWGPERPLTWLACVSASQRANCLRFGGSPLLVPNGIDVERFRNSCTRRTYVRALGRVCPEKGFHLALEAAALARQPMFLAGEVKPFEDHRRYLREEIEPRLDSCRRFIGPVGFRKKRRLLAGANCLLIPSLVAETSSLVAMEAMACGTPVIAFPSGALLEIVRNGISGYLVKDVSQMAHAIDDVDRLWPEDARAVAAENFSAETMANGYEAMYERIVAESREERRIAA
jgi:glycosyltransferase involved in cell wall biosynthesis